MKKFFCTVLLCFIICSLPVFAQTTTATGTVERIGEGKYLADITIKNAQDDAVVVVALYNGDEMTGVAISKNAESRFETEIFAQKADKAKIFVWKSLKNITPACKTKAVAVLNVVDLEITTPQTVKEGTYKNITIAPSVADGDVTLENVTIRGNLTVLGGGSNSVNLNNCTINGKVIMNKASGQAPRLNLTNTHLSKVEVLTESIIDTDDYISVVDKIVTTADVTVDSRVAPFIEVSEETENSIEIDVEETNSVEVIVNTLNNVNINGSSIFVTTDLESTPQNVTKNNFAINHICKWDEIQTISEASCESGGSYAYVCKVSGSSHSRILYTKPLPHELTGNINYGSYDHWYECANCQNKVDPKEHKFSKDFSCTTGGKCTDCDFEIAPGSSHRYGMYNTTTPPTCSSTGIRTAYCELCGHEDNQTVYKLTHSYPTEPTRIDKPTCTAGGYNYFMCTRDNCTYEKKTALSSLGHTTDVGYDVVKAATCTQEGTKAQICTRCKTTIKTKTIPMLAHTKNEGTVTQAATCTAKGIKTYTCTACTTQFTEEIPYIQHNHVDGTCTVCTKKEYVDVATSTEFSNNIRNGQSVRLTQDMTTAGTASDSVATIYLNGHKIDKLEIGTGDIIVDGSGGGSIGEVYFRGNVSSLTIKNTAVTTKISTATKSKLYMENCSIQYMDANYSDVLKVTNCSIGSYSKINSIKEVELNNITSENQTLSITSCNNVTVNGAQNIKIAASGSEYFTVNHTNENPVNLNTFSYGGTGVLKLNGGTYAEKFSSSATEEVILNNVTFQKGFSQSSKVHKLTVNGGEFYSFSASVTPNGTVNITGGTYGQNSSYSVINISGGTGKVSVSDMYVKDNLGINAGDLTVSNVKVDRDATFAGKNLLTVNEGNIVNGTTTFTTDGIATINGGTYIGKSTVDYYDIYETTGRFEINGGTFGDKYDTTEALKVYADTEISGGKFNAKTHGIYIYDGKTVTVSGDVEFDTSNVAMHCYEGKLVIKGYKSSSYYLLASNTYGTIESADEITTSIQTRGGYLILRNGFTTSKNVSTPDTIVEKPKIFFEEGIVINGKLSLSNACDGEVDGISGGILGGTYNGETKISGRNTDLTIAGGTFEKITFESLSATSVVILDGTFKDFNVDANKGLIIAGGTFNVDVSEYVNSELYNVIENNDGTYTVVKK